MSTRKTRHSKSNIIHKPPDHAKTEFLGFKWAWYALGMLLFAFGLSVMIRFPGLGLEPWSAAHVALSKLGFTIGTWTAIIQAIFLLLIVIIGKRNLRIGTWISLILEGFLIDWFLAHTVLPNHSPLMMYVMGMILASIGAAMLLRSHLGAGAKTQFYYVMHKYKHIPIWKIKMLCEAVAIAIGWMGGAHLGIGTLIMATMSGLLIQLLFTQLERVSFPLRRAVRSSKQPL